MVVGLLTKCASFWSESASGAIFRAVTQQGGVLSSYPLYRGKILSQAESTAKCLTLSEPHEEEWTTECKHLSVCNRHLFVFLSTSLSSSTSKMELHQNHLQEKSSRDSLVVDDYSESEKDLLISFLSSRTRVKDVIFHFKAIKCCFSCRNNWLKVIV